MNLTSYIIAKSIDQQDRPFTDGEFIKQTFLDCSPILFQGMENSEKIIKRIESIPISRNTVRDRIQEMKINVQEQLYNDLSTANFFLFP
jgi:hypothetical protein